MFYNKISVLNSLREEVKESDNKLNNIIIPSQNGQKIIEKEIDEEYARTVHHPVENIPILP